MLIERTSDRLTLRCRQPWNAKTNPCRHRFERVPLPVLSVLWYRLQCANGFAKRRTTLFSKNTGASISRSSFVFSTRHQTKCSRQNKIKTRFRMYLLGLRLENNLVHGAEVVYANLLYQPRHVTRVGFCRARVRAQGHDAAHLFALQLLQEKPGQKKNAREKGLPEHFEKRRAVSMFFQSSTLPIVRCVRSCCRQSWVRFGVVGTAVAKQSAPTSIRNKAKAALNLRWISEVGPVAAPRTACPSASRATLASFPTKQ